MVTCRIPGMESAWYINESGVLIGYEGIYDQNLGRVYPHDQLVFCQRVERYQYMQFVFVRIIMLFLFMLSMIGLLGAVLMCKTFWHPSFTGPSFIYHKSVAVHEIIVMIVMIIWTFLDTIGLPGNGPHLSPGWLWYLCNSSGWIYGDGSKLAVTIIAMFVSIERVLALWFPTKFHLVNTKQVALSGVLLSTAIGSLHMLPFPACLGMKYNLFDFWFNSDYIVWRVLPSVKFSASLATCVFSVFIVIGLKKQGAFKAAVAATSSSDQLVVMKQMSMLTLLLSTTTTVDNMLFLIWRQSLMNRSDVISFECERPFVQEHLPPEDVFKCLMRILDMAFIEQPLWFTQAVTSALFHCTRFYTYVLLYGRFRDTFFGMIELKTQVKSISVPAQNITASTSNGGVRVMSK